MVDLLKVTGLDLYVYHHIPETRTGAGYSLKWCTDQHLAVGSAALLAAAHCPYKRTLDPQSAAKETHMCSQPATLWPSGFTPQCSKQQQLTSFY